MFDSNKWYSRLCAESSGSNPSMMVSNTKHMAKERCSHLILKTNIDNHLPFPPPPSGPTHMVQGNLENLETHLGFSLLYFFPRKIILEFSPILKERQVSPCTGRETKWPRGSTQPQAGQWAAVIQILREQFSSKRTTGKIWPLLKIDTLHRKNRKTIPNSNKCSLFGKGT